MLTKSPYAWYQQGLLLGLVSLTLGTVFILQAAYQYVKLAISTQAYTLEDLALSQW